MGVFGCLHIILLINAHTLKFTPCFYHCSVFTITYLALQWRPYLTAWCESLSGFCSLCILCDNVQSVFVFNTWAYNRTHKYHAFLAVQQRQGSQHDHHLRSPTFQRHSHKGNLCLDKVTGLELYRVYPSISDEWTQ